MNDEIVKRHLENGTAESRAMYQRFLEILDGIGPYTIHPAKSTITFKGSRRGFSGAHPKNAYLRGYFDLTRALPPDPRIVSVSPYTKRLYVHQFRLSHVDELDEVFQSWIREAYRVGEGHHLK